MTSIKTHVQIEAEFNEQFKQSTLPSVSDYVSGPTSSTDNAIARFDSTTGKLIQNSLVTVDDSGNMVVPVGATVDGVDISLKDAEMIFGISIDNTVPPTNGQLLKYNSVTGKWEYAAGTIAAHASTHENGGSDEVNVVGLSGLLADVQNAGWLQGDAVKALPNPSYGEILGYESTDGDGWRPVADAVPRAHDSTHENGGADEISVAGLSGLLADGQTPLAHGTSHQNGSGDEINVGGLSGKLNDVQNAGWLQNYSVSAAVPSVGQVLVWMGSAWTPTSGISHLVSPINVAAYDVTGNQSAHVVYYVEYTATGECTIRIMSAAIAIDGLTITIKDQGNNASINKINITTEGSELIEGETDARIEVDSTALTLQAYDGNLYVI